MSRAKRIMSLSPHTTSPVASIAPSPEPPDVGGEERRLALHHLEAVLVAGVVAPGDHDAAVGVQVMHGEVEERRRADADVDDVDTAAQETLAERFEHAGRGQSAI